MLSSSMMKAHQLAVKDSAQAVPHLRIVARVHRAPQSSIRRAPAATIRRRSSSTGQVESTLPNLPNCHTPPPPSRHTDRTSATNPNMRTAYTRRTIARPRNPVRDTAIWIISIRPAFTTTAEESILPLWPTSREPQSCRHEHWWKRR